MKEEMATEVATEKEMVTEGIMATEEDDKRTEILRDRFPLFAISIVEAEGRKLGLQFAEPVVARASDFACKVTGQECCNLSKRQQGTSRVEVQVTSASTRARVRGRDLNDRRPEAMDKHNRPPQAVQANSRRGSGVGHREHQSSRPSYAEVLQRGSQHGRQEGLDFQRHGEAGRQEGHSEHGHLPRHKLSRCFRCLGQGHLARDCRDPVICHRCSQSCHRHAACTSNFGSHQPRQKGPDHVRQFMGTTLVGEVLDGAPSTASLIQGLTKGWHPIRISTQVDLQQLKSGDFLL